MKIMATCDNCQRDLLLSRLVEGPGMSAKVPVVRDAAGPHYNLEHRRAA